MRHSQSGTPDRASSADGDLRAVAAGFFQEAVRAADPARAVRAALANDPLPGLDGGRHILMALGKAACAMLEAARDCLPESANFTALAVTNYENARPVAGCQVVAAAHPVPDESGLKAAQQIMDLADSARAKDHVLCLISGGGSALVPAPIAGISLADKIVVNQLLLANGFDIIDTNLVRQQLSRLKGGGLARLARLAAIRSLIISDVIGDDIRAIASGPTGAPLGGPADAIRLLQGRGIWDQVPERVRQHLSQPSDQVAGAAHGRNDVVSSNLQSLRAVAQAAVGWKVEIITDQLQGDVADAARAISDRILANDGDLPQLLLWGGETTVTLRGTGLGGRNQEFALRVAQNLRDMPGDWLFVSAGTDGRDGPTDGAGGMVDAGTISRIRAAGGDADAFLRNNDSYHALKLAGDLFQPGATGTNVADIQMFLRR